MEDVLGTGLSDRVKMESQLVRVPFEHLKKTIRVNHRCAESSLSAVIADISRSDGDDVDAVTRLTSLVSRLQGLKRKLGERSVAENALVQRCRARFNHLHSSRSSSIVPNSSTTRLDRFLVDYMLRFSYYNTAISIAKTNGIQDFVDIDVFLEAKKVVDALQNREVSVALAWCAENKSKLKKSRSKLEFELRLQEFIELVRKDNNLQAITYARKYLAQWGSTHMKELQHVMATLAFKSNTECTTYKILFDLNQWDLLVELFKQEFCRLYGVTLQPLLNIFLQAGLSVLKTPFCFQEGCTKEDPLSQSIFRKLAAPLPFSKQQRSRLVCYITKELMDTDNPPLVLPNGYVYSTKALEEMAKNNDGRILCPRTGYSCNFSELVKAYIS